MDKIDVMGVINLTASIASIIAFGFAIWQTREARKQTKDLCKISHSLSTKYLNKFPEYIEYLGDFIRRARKSVRILTTVPAPGLFHAHGAWQSMKRAIEDTQQPDKNIAMTCIFLKRDGIEKFIEDQFVLAKTNWSSWREMPEKKKLLQDYLSKYDPGKDAARLTYQEFVNSILTTCDNILQEVYRGRNCNVWEASVPIAVYMWIIDDAEATFAVTATQPAYFAEAFWTRDQKIIEALIKLYEGYLNCATQINRLNLERDNRGEDTPSGVSKQIHCLVVPFRRIAKACKSWLEKI